jgi:hypothetical protein
MLKSKGCKLMIANPYTYPCNSLVGLTKRSKKEGLAKEAPGKWRKIRTGFRLMLGENELREEVRPRDR